MLLIFSKLLGHFTYLWNENFEAHTMLLANLQWPIKFEFRKSFCIFQSCSDKIVKFTYGRRGAQTPYDNLEQYTSIDFKNVQDLHIRLLYQFWVIHQGNFEAVKNLHRSNLSFANKRHLIIIYWRYIHSALKVTILAPLTLSLHLLEFFNIV